MIESQAGKGRMALYPTAGLQIFAQVGKGFGGGIFGGGAFGTGLLTVGNIRRILKTNVGTAGERLFIVAENLTQQALWEVSASGKETFRANLGASGTQPSITYNNASQLLVSSAGRVFLYDMKANSILEILTNATTQIQGSVSQVESVDGYFIALLANSQKFQISALLDGTSWSPLDIAQVSLFPDNIVGMRVDHRELWFWGSKAAVAYYDTGSAGFPFSPIPGVYIEQGLAAQFATSKLDNSMLWLGADERGNGMAWRAQGYTPQRVSNHAVEFAWQNYPTISDAITYSFQDQGHSFWHVYFPTANKSWRYDVATNMWHEVAYVDGTAHRSRCHEFAFGKHLVGDWNSGTIYQMSINFHDDAGTPIRRVRRAPHISNEQEWMFFKQLQVDVEAGLGPIPPLLDGAGFPRDPMLTLRWSDDAGHTWSNGYSVGAGQAGKYKTRAIWRRLGRSRDRVFEVEASDPIPWRLVEAYVK